MVCVAIVLMPAANARVDPDFAALERAAIEEIRATNTPGAAVAVISGGRVVFSGAFGIASVETRQPVTTDMLFRIASTTKMFTAAAVVQLAEQDKIELDAPMGRYIKALHPRLAALSADQALSHMAGLWQEAPQHGPQDETALGEEVRRWGDDRFFAPAGAIFSYSNQGYWLAGLLIEEAGGKLFADQVDDSLFRPLGMAHSTFRPLVALTYPNALGHDVSPTGVISVVRPLANNAATWPAGSLFTNIADLSRFVIAFMNEGRIEGQQVLSPSLISTLSSPQADIPGSADKYGYGLLLREFRGVHLVEHDGRRLGHGSLIRMAPQHGFAVIVLTNRSGGQLPVTVGKAMEMFLPLAAAKPSERPKPKPMSAAEMRRHVGSYSQGPANRVEIAMRNGKLFAERGGAQVEMTRLDAGRFSLLPPGATEPLVLAAIAGPDRRTQFVHMGANSFRRMD
jgi:CubicO group peptidase (beta-lactamase class C family)